MKEIKKEKKQQAMKQQQQKIMKWSITLYEKKDEVNSSFMAFYRICSQFFLLWKFIFFFFIFFIRCLNETIRDYSMWQFVWVYRNTLTFENKWLLLCQVPDIFDKNFFDLTRFFFGKNKRLVLMATLFTSLVSLYSY